MEAGVTASPMPRAQPPLSPTTAPSGRPGRRPEIRRVDGGSIREDEASGLISAGGDGISIGAGAETVSNRGTIVSTGTFDSAVFLGDGGLVTNGARNATSALIDGLWIGVDFKTVIGTVDNLGTIESTATFSNRSSLAGVSGTLLGVGVIMQQGGTLTNGVSGSNVGLITGYALGVYIGGGSGIPNAGAAGTVFNYGDPQHRHERGCGGGRRTVVGRDRHKFRSDRQRRKKRDPAEGQRRHGPQLRDDQERQQRARRDLSRRGRQGHQRVCHANAQRSSTARSAPASRSRMSPPLWTISA